MKIIDLLNKIANGEKVPKAIKYNDIIYKKADVGEDYYNFTIHKWFFKDVFDVSGVNLEIEIIEEDNKIKKISPYVLCDSDFTKKGNYLTKATEIIDSAFEEMCNKINEIIEVINNEYNK